MNVTANVGGLRRTGFWAKTIATGLACAILSASTQGALSARCKPNHFRPPFFIKTMGACGFDPQTLSFSGTPVEQAKCLMRGMDYSRNLAPPLTTLPPVLAERVGGATGLPSREALSAYLSKQGLEWNFAAYLWQPVSRADDNDPNAPMARYFVIHDTSGPNYGHRSFPVDLDVRVKINNLSHFACADGWGKAHIVVNRAGDMLLDHELAFPWRETKFEQAANFAGALKGLFLHVELVQPRRSAVGRGRRNDAQSPDPAFTAAQYDRLALLYMIASVRAEHWLVPAFHAAIDSQLRNGHDDPLNFDTDSFADSLQRLVNELAGGTDTVASASAAGRTMVPWGEVDGMPGLYSSVTSPDSSVISSLEPATMSNVSDHDAVKEPAPETSAGSVPAHQTERKADNNGDTGLERQKTTEHCQARAGHGHRSRTCATDVAESRKHQNQKSARAIRQTDHRVSEQGFGAWHSGGDVHARHARGASRHGRA